VILLAGVSPNAMTVAIHCIPVPVMTMTMITAMTVARNGMIVNVMTMMTMMID
jgi:hypothetical protein